MEFLNCIVLVHTAAATHDLGGKPVKFPGNWVSSRATAGNKWSPDENVITHFREEVTFAHKMWKITLRPEISDSSRSRE